VGGVTKAAVTGCDAKFVLGAATLLRDVKKFHPDVRRVCITPAADAAAVQAQLGGLATVMPAPRDIRVVPANMQPALLKLFTPLVEADVAVWIDCDMILCRPAPELWDVQPGEVVAVQDTAYKILHMVEPELREQYTRQFPAIVEGRGFNGGLFALRCDEWKDLPERYEAAFDAGGYAVHPKIWDQPFLNGLFQPNVRYLPRAFNAHHVFDYSIPRDVRLVHFTNVPKPWQLGYPQHEPAYWYWLRYGLQETRFVPLAMAKLRIWRRTPRRLLSRWWKGERGA
jgi:Glycosyl transferase family 8